MNLEKDTGGFFKIISDFKQTHRHNFVFTHANISSFRHKFAYLHELLLITVLIFLLSASPNLTIVFQMHSSVHKDIIYSDKITPPLAVVLLYM